MSSATRPEVRTKVDSGVEWEREYGYCRAHRIGQRILVSGTTASSADGPRHPGDARAQARYVLAKIEAAVVQLGGELTDIVRTRVYVRPGADWQAVATAHGEVFAGVRPANTLLFAELVGDELLVEIEAEAIVGAGDLPVEWVEWHEPEGRS